MNEKSKRNNNLYIFSTKTPWQFIFVVILYTIGAVSFPTSIFTKIFGDTQTANILSIFLSRLICCILPLWLIFEVKNQNILLPKLLLRSLIIIFPFLLVVINNFPIVSILSNKVIFNSNNDTIKWICYALAVLGGVLIEEITFRGLILPTVYRHFRFNKNCIFLTVIVQSGLFAIVHLVNLFSGSSILPVLMQIGYSFLIGAMCGIAFIKTGNFYFTIVLHFIFNFGGLLYDYDMISGSIWIPASIIVTLVIALIAILYAFYLVFVDKNDELKDILIISEEE